MILLYLNAVQLQTHKIVQTMKNIYFHARVPPVLIHGQQNITSACILTGGRKLFSAFETEHYKVPIYCSETHPFNHKTMRIDLHLKRCVHETTCLTGMQGYGRCSDLT